MQNVSSKVEFNLFCMQGCGTQVAIYSGRRIPICVDQPDRGSFFAAADSHARQLYLYTSYPPHHCDGCRFSFRAHPRQSPPEGERCKAGFPEILYLIEPAE
jgi:hypothetical protein